MCTINQVFKVETVTLEGLLIIAHSYYIAFSVVVFFLQTGNLRFSHILHEDGRDGARYTCVVHNQIMMRTQQGEYSIIAPQGGENSTFVSYSSKKIKSNRSPIAENGLSYRLLPFLILFHCICDAAQVWGGPSTTEHTKECLLPRRPGC